MADFEKPVRVAVAMEILGLAKSTVYDMASAGTIPSYKLGGTCVRFKESELRAWREEQRRVRS